MQRNRALFFVLLSAALTSTACELDVGGTDDSKGDPAVGDPGSGDSQDPVSEADASSPSADQTEMAGPISGGGDTNGGTSDASSGEASSDGGAATDAAAGGLDGGSASDAGGSLPAPDAKVPAPDAKVPEVDAGAPNPSKRCGTRGGIECSDSQFCNFNDAQCGATDRGGVCETKPQACTTQYAPVCGCDNRTYPNSCDAHSNGVSVKHNGACTPDECKAAGGKPKYSTGADIPMCGANEQQWPISGGIEPVVCCLKRDGDPKPGKTCGGIAGLQCEGKSFCNYEPEAGGQGCDGRIADAAGVCEPIPTGCTKEYQQPVCGCDNRTYANACSAHAAGVSVKKSGTCQIIDCVAEGGEIVPSTGAAPKCPPGKVSLGILPIVPPISGGPIPIEGPICCIVR